MYMYWYRYMLTWVYLHGDEFKHIRNFPKNLFDSNTPPYAHTCTSGASVSNANRWAPLPVGPLTNLRSLVRMSKSRKSAVVTTPEGRKPSLDSITSLTRSVSRASHSSNDSGYIDLVPLTQTGFVETSRKVKEAQRQAIERERVFQHAKKQGVEDVELWMESLEESKDTRDAVATDFTSNCWGKDQHECVSVSHCGLILTPNYTSMQDYNVLVRAHLGLHTGRHYWEITLERFALCGQGWHCIGVASKDVATQGEPGQIVMSSNKHAACLCLENCQKLRGSARPSEYGKRSIKQGDVVGVLLDLDLGELSFFINGIDMGVAFYGMRGPLYPAVEVGMMVGRQQTSTPLHQYRANFAAQAPPRRKVEAPLMSDEQVFRNLSATLPITSRKCAQQGSGAILSVPSTMPLHAAPGGIRYRITTYPQFGEYLVHGAEGVPKAYGIMPLSSTNTDDIFAR